MREALVFASQSQLDFHEIRENVIRIPEVVMRVREAQKIWDNLDMPALDIANFISSDDAVFLGNIRTKAFVTAVIQVGLLDRYLKNFNLPEVIVGLANGDAPLKVVVGEITFFDLISENLALSAPRKLQPIPSSGELPFLAGIQLSKYAAYKRQADGSFQLLASENPSLENLLQTLVSQESIERIVVVGPGSSLRKSSLNIKVSDSIDLDPMLKWFWSSQEPKLVAVN